MISPADHTTILIVDDHALVREGLRGILEAQDDMHVVGEAGDSAATIALTSQQRPDIVLLDVEIPGGEAADTEREIRSRSPRSRVIILSMYEGPQLVQDLLAVGIRGYLLKSVHWQELVVAIRAVITDGDRVILGVSRESLRQMSQVPEGSTLSGREQEILDLVGHAYSNSQIASRLNVTEATVKRHLRNVFIKLGAVSRIDAVNKSAGLRERAVRSVPQRPGAGAPDLILGGLGERLCQPGARAAAQPDGRRGGVHLQVDRTAGARYRDEIIALRKQPGQCQPRHTHVKLGCLVLQYPQGGLLVRAHRGRCAAAEQATG